MGGKRDSRSIWGHIWLLFSCQVVSDSLWAHGLYSPLYSPGQNTEEYFPFSRDFPTQGSNPGLTHCGKIVYQLSHQGSPIILEWVAYLVSRRSSRSRNEPRSPALQADSLPAELPGKTYLPLPPPFPLQDSSFR